MEASKTEGVEDKRWSLAYKADWEAGQNYRKIKSPTDSYIGISLIL
jgi:hypothetical protein